MKIDKNNKIIECTEDELFMFWLTRWSEFTDYYSFKNTCKQLGTKVIEPNED